MDPFHDEVRSMQNKLRMSMNKPDDTVANRLNYDMIRLENSVQNGKNKQVIVNHMKQLQGLVTEAKRKEVLDYSHASVINSWLDDSINKFGR